MSPSSLIHRNAALALALAVSLPAVSWGQSWLPGSGGEYAIAGSLPGDQVRPALSINGSGGYLVWEDNGMDANGSSIGAVGLDSSLREFQTPFRVNQNNMGNQERPQVALLNTGGAVFVWQGGRPGFQHIYAHFVSVSNTWIGGDIRASTPTSNFQVNPSVAVLTNGNVIVVWGSYNQFSASSMQDVYGQLFAPNGQKIGSEFLINQFTSYNQRNPSVAALAGGGFVVVWVSEQQTAQFVLPTAANLVTNMSHASVDIYGRLYGGDGSAASDEFQVNTGTDICADPRAASGNDGSFMVVWGQRSAGLSPNSWDVFARGFSSSSPTAGGAVRVVNTTVYGDQYLPQVAGFGTNYLVVWTTLGQDGDREGVYGQFLAGDTTSLGGEFLVNTTTISRQMQPNVAGDGLGRFLAMWTGYVGRHNNGFDLFGQAYAGTNFVPPAPTFTYGTPPPLPVTNNPPITGPGSTPLPPVGLPYPGTMDTNGFMAVKGIYSGLFYGTNGVTPLTAGSFSIATTGRGTYSAKLSLGKRTYAFSGRFDANGASSKTINRGGGLPALTVELQVTGDQVQGTVSTASWSASILANLQSLAKSSASQTQPGTYTIILPPDTNALTGPAGFGFGTLKLDAKGNVRWAGTLADGTKVTQKTTLSKDGIWPIYSSLYSGAGSVIGWVQFEAEANADLSGQVVWMKPVGSGGKNYWGGFTNNVSAEGSVYAAPVRGSRALSLDKGVGTLIFNGAGLSVTNTIALDSHNHVTVLDGPKLTLTVTPASGLFRGVLSTASRKVSFQGCLYQDTTNGFGFYLNPTQSGSVIWSAAP